MEKEYSCVFTDKYIRLRPVSPASPGLAREFTHSLYLPTCLSEFTHLTRVYLPRSGSPAGCTRVKPDVCVSEHVKMG